MSESQRVLKQNSLNIPYEFLFFPTFKTNTRLVYIHIHMCNYACMYIHPIIIKENRDGRL